MHVSCQTRSEAFSLPQTFPRAAMYVRRRRRRYNSKPLIRGQDASRHSDIPPARGAMICCTSSAWARVAETIIGVIRGTTASRASGLISLFYLLYSSRKSLQQNGALLTSLASEGCCGKGRVVTDGDWNSGCCYTMQWKGPAHVLLLRVDLRGKDKFRRSGCGRRQGNRLAQTWKPKKSEGTRQSFKSYYTLYQI